MVLREHVQCTALKRDYPYLSNVNADPRLIGYPAVLNPFVQFNSASRLYMWTSHRTQSLVIKGSEFPDCFSGFEKEDSQYTFDSSRRDQDVEILKVFPKYQSMRGGVGGNNSPHLMVLHRGLRDNKIGCFPIDRYFKITDGFGHVNKWHNIPSALTENSYLTKDTKLITSPAMKGSKYCVGLNANVAYMPVHQVIEDAVVVSESFAQKLESDEFRTIVINIRQDVRPLDLYYKNGESKFLPDIGEVVRDDGILCAFRPVSTTTCAADTDPMSLREVETTRDIVFEAPPGAEIVDIDFYVNNQCRIHSYPQVQKYLDSIEVYWRTIYDFYKQSVHNKFQMTGRFNTLVTKALKQLVALGKRHGIPAALADTRRKIEFEGMNGHPVEFIQAVVTYRATRHATVGFKVAGRAGNKGVIGEIRKDSEMPVDDFGVRADIIIDPASVTARMNEGQHWEQGINRISEFVRRRAKNVYDTGNIDLAYDVLLEWYNDVNPNYAQLVRAQHPEQAQRKKHLEDVFADFIKLHIPPFLQTLGNLDVFLEWCNKWEVPRSPVTYVVRGRNGENPRTERTECNVDIGREMFEVLAKIPHGTSCGIAFESHLGTPIKPGKEAKHSSPVSRSPIRMGEDENRVMNMDMPAGEVERLMRLYAKSPISGVNNMISALLTEEYPTQIRRIAVSNDELSRGNTVLGTFHHETSVLGIDTRNTATDKLPPENLSAGDDILFMDTADLSDLEDGGGSTVRFSSSGADTDEPFTTGKKKKTKADDSSSDDE